MLQTKNINLPVLLVFAAAAIFLFGCEESQILAPERGNDISSKHDGFSQASNSSVKGVHVETSNVYGQEDMDGNRELYAEDAATLRRTPNGISFKVQMPTPESGTYNYPEGAEEGQPEAFTLWVFVFDDAGSENWTGAFLGSGHVIGGPKLNLSGHISKETEPFLDDKLQNPGEAKIHLAVAPHGEVDPDKLPDQIKTPSGSGPFWWLAVFD